MFISKMKKSIEFLFNVLVILLALGAAFLIAFFTFNRYSVGLWNAFAFFIIGAVLAVVFNTVVHEAGHILFAKNNFRIMSVRFFFFTFHKEKGRIKCDFNFFIDSSGATETIPLSKNDLEKKYVKMTWGGLLGSFLCFVLSLGFVFTFYFLPYWAYCIIAVAFPISTYYLAVNALPMTPDGTFNDGGVIYSIKKNTDSAKVMINVLKIQAEINNGKTYSEVPEHLYFNLPQLPETDINFAMLLSVRYNYYLDKGEDAKAHSVAERLSQLDNLSDDYIAEIKSMLLYDACAVKPNENEADDLMEETEKYLNGKVNATVLRIKCAYLLYVVKDKEKAKTFFEEGLKLCEADPISGVGKFEKKLFLKMQKDM